MTTTMISKNKNVGQFGDTTLTKVFVGGLAWETPRETLRQHFEKYGEILEAVIISDKFSGRSKGYGFVTFKEAEAAKKACDDPTPIINGRRANCNLASLGARRPMSSTNSFSCPPVLDVPRNTITAAAASQVHWYYPIGTPASPFHHQPLALYGYIPTYIAPNANYNQKLSYGGGGAHMNLSGQMCQMQSQRQANTLMPMYPPYQFHPGHTMGFPAAHFFQPTMPMPAIMSKPPAIPPTQVE